VLGIFLAWANYCCIQAKRNSRQLSIDENLHSLFLKQIITSSFVLLQNIKGDLMKHPVSLLSCALLLCGFSSSPWAADVPQGTVLAQKQELVRHIKDEPASLDPAKAVGLPEIQVIRDLYEGLVNQNEKGDIIPGDITFYRLQSTADNKLRAYIAQGEVLPAATRSFGAIGIFAIPQMGRFYRHVLIEKNFPHHGAVAFGHYGKAIYEIFKFIGVDVEEIGFNQPAGMLYKTENPFA